MKASLQDYNNQDTAVIYNRLSRTLSALVHSLGWVERVSHIHACIQYMQHVLV